MRNFLYRVKHKDEIIPDIDSTLFIESRKYELINCLKKLFENDNNITVIKFLNNMPSEIPDISDIDNMNIKGDIKSTTFQEIMNRQHNK